MNYHFLWIIFETALMKLLFAPYIFKVKYLVIIW